MSKEFKVGDPVTCILNGKGVVINIRESQIYFPVVVEFQSGQKDAYTPEGRQFKLDSVPSLHHGHGIFEIKFTPDPEPVYEWQWKMRHKYDGFIQYTGHYKKESDILKAWPYCMDNWEIVERDESTKREVKP
jgi:hypothetical protein